MKHHKSLFVTLTLLMLFSSTTVIAQDNVLVSNATNNINLLKNQKDPNRPKYIENLKTVIKQSKSSSIEVRRKLMEMLYVDTNTDLKIVLLQDVMSAFGNEKESTIKANLDKYIKEIKPELWEIVKGEKKETAAVCYSAASALNVIQEPEISKYLAEYAVKMNEETLKEAENNLLEKATQYVRNINASTRMSIQDQTELNLESLKNLIEESAKSPIESRRKLLKLLRTIKDKQVKVRLMKKILMAYRNEKDEQIQKGLKNYIRDIKDELWVNAKGGSNKDEKGYLAAYALKIIDEPNAQEYVDKLKYSSPFPEDK